MASPVYAWGVAGVARRPLAPDALGVGGEQTEAGEGNQGRPNLKMWKERKSEFLEQTQQELDKYEENEQTGTAEGWLRTRGRSLLSKLNLGG